MKTRTFKVGDTVKLSGEFIRNIDQQATDNNTYKYLNRSGKIINIKLIGSNNQYVKIQWNDEIDAEVSGALASNLEKC